MTERSVTHTTFVIERTYPSTPSQVFHALADKEAKSKWFADPRQGGRKPKLEMDFRVGGRESNSGGPEGRPVHRFNALYHDIVPDQRIIYSYDMHIGDTRISVSLATIELEPEGTGPGLPSPSRARSSTAMTTPPAANAARANCSTRSAPRSREQLWVSCCWPSPCRWTGSLPVLG